MKKKVLLTGGTGFVGRQVIKYLSKQDIDLTLITRQAFDHREFSDMSINSVIHSKDIFSEDLGWWKESLKDIDVLIHLAWFVEPGEYLTSEKNIDCLIGSLRMTNAARAVGVKRVIMTGTCFEYDLTNGIASIETPLNPLTPYAAAKAALFTFLNQWLPSQEIGFAWCRLFYLYGDNEHPKRLVPYIRSQIEAGKTVDLTSGNQIRDFMDVEDAGKMIARISLSDSNGPFNICSGKGTTVRDMAEKIADEYDRKDLLNFNSRDENKFDPPTVIGVLNS